MKKFIEKYKIIVVLVAMIVVLAFVKSYFGKKINENNPNNTSTITPTIISKKINDSEQEITKTPSNSVTSNNSSVQVTENNLQNKGLIINSEETDNRRKELTEKSQTYQTDEEFESWFETLSIEDQDLLLGYNRITISQLSDELPYEGETFIVKSIMSNSVIQAKSKIDDLEKAEIDVKTWLSSQAISSENLIISWEQ